MSTGVERWAELRDREALGEPVTEREREECEALERDDASVRAQAAPFRELSRMLERASVSRPSAEDRDIVDRALLSVRVTNGRAVSNGADADAEIERAVDPEGPFWIRPTAVAISILLPAAAAVALMLYEPQAAPSKRPVTSSLATRALAPTVVELAHARTAARGPRLFRSGRVLPWQTELVEGDRVESGANPGCLVLDRGVDVCLAPGSELKLTSLSRSERSLEVQRGHAIARLDPQAPNDGFELRAGAVRALAQGTIYSLERSETDEVRVRVLEGNVKILASAVETKVSASQIATYRTIEQGVTVAALPGGHAARMWELLATRGLVADPVIKPAADVSAPPNDAAAGEPSLANEPPPATDSALVPPAVDPAARGAGPANDENAAARSSAQAAKPDARALLHDAWEQLKTKRWVEAAATYARILRELPKSEEAHVVLVRLGDLQLEHLDEPAQALASYERYLREGGGPLETEARFGVIQALSRLGRVGAERVAVEEFLAKHPTSLKTAALRERLRSLSR